MNYYKFIVYVHIVICVGKLVESKDNNRIRYEAVLRRLKDIFKNEKHHPVRDILTGLRASYKGYNGKLTCFHFEECLCSAETAKEVFDFIEKECSYFSYTILERFVQKSKCNKAEELVKHYIEYIQSAHINVQTCSLKYEKDTKILEIIHEKDQLLVKELNNIIVALERSLKLPKACLLVKDVDTQNCIIVCKISFEVEEHLLENTFTTQSLKELSNLKIQCVIVRDKMELKIPSDCDKKVCT